MAQRQNKGHSNRNIKQLAYKNGIDLRERSVGENSLSGYGPIKFMNRRMRCNAPRRQDTFLKNLRWFLS